MESTIRQYNVSIFPCQETKDAPSAAIRMEVAGGFEEFYREVMEWETWGQGCGRPKKAAGSIQIANII